MALRYRFDVFKALCADYIESDLQEFFGERDFQALKNGEIVSIEQIDGICYLLGCQVGFLLEYYPATEYNEVVSRFERRKRIMEFSEQYKKARF